MGPATRRCGGCGAAVPPEGGLGGGWFGNPSSCRLRLGPTSGSWVSPETRLYPRVRDGRPCWAGRGSRAPRRWRPTCPSSAPLAAWLTSPAAFCALESQACCCPLHVLTPCLAGRSPSVPAQTSAPRRGPLRHPPPRPAAAGRAVRQPRGARHAEAVCPLCPYACALLPQKL